LWGHGLKQRETRGIKIQPKMAEFCGFFKVFDATPAGVLVPRRGRRWALKSLENFRWVAVIRAASCRHLGKRRPYSHCPKSDIGLMHLE
jgi:hypothetical protein